MSFLRKTIGIFAIFCMLTGLTPLGAHNCAHASEQAAVAEASLKAAEEPPCPMHAAPALQKQAQDTHDAKNALDCCGDNCACGIGNCHNAPMLPSAQSILRAPDIAQSGTAATIARLDGFTPELPTPPPKD